MESATRFLYIVFGAISAAANIPILVLILTNYKLRTKYPTVVGTLIVDFICLICLIISGILYFIKNEKCIPEIIASSLPILQSVNILCSSVDYILARFRPIFHHDPPKSYRILIFAITVTVTSLLIFISFYEEGLFKEDINTCPTRDGHIFVYSLCIIFNFISLTFHGILFKSLQDLQFKYAITLRFMIISSLIFTPSLIVVLLCFFENENSVQIGIVISNILITVEIIANAMMQLRNNDLKTVCNNLIRKMRKQ